MARETTQPDPEHVLKVQQLFVQHEGRLRAYVLSLAPDFAMAADALQETFLVVTRRAADFEIGSNFLAWARRIAMFKVLALLRDQKRGPECLSANVIETLAAADSPEDDEEQHAATLERLRECLGRLAPAARELIRLRYLNQHLPGEIALLRAQSVNAINVTLSRARVALRDCMERKLEVAHEG